MKRKIFIFILLLTGLAACETMLVNVASGDSGKSCCGNQYEILSSCCHDSYIDKISGNPVASTIFLHFGNFNSGYVRTMNRSVRPMFRYCPNSFLKNGKFIDFSVTRSFLDKRDVFSFVKPSGNHVFIRICQLLI